MEKILEVITNELMVLMIATMPLVELRGAIPIGVSLGLHPLHATLIAILGSLIPMPFLYLFLEPVLKHLSKIKLLDRLVDRISQRTLENSKKVRRFKRYSIIGLVVFVAIPIPSTGVWSGCLVALLLNIPFRYALPAISLGTIIAGTIIFVLTYWVAIL